MSRHHRGQTGDSIQSHHSASSVSCAALVKKYNQESGEFKWTPAEYLWLAVEIPVLKIQDTCTIYYEESPSPISLRRTREQLLSPRAFTRHTSRLVQWALV
ncbi:uncharacterized protein LOC122148563 isoform X2 [Cyprinus carpio]|uniref:Uncharacterized protein LOC122148563 isoform X2 n=1 Tax=Cyprinus carpio TaxID=7962 RepID=A0A9R0BCV6_CYPCA|nr:uncharacterized protein LOC122148563 isoform X2 [Cyprinus carpio]